MNAEEHDLEIRPARSSRDLEQSAALMAGTEPWITLQLGYEGLLRGLERPTVDKRVAVAGGEVVGIVTILMDGPLTGYIGSLAVASGWRGRGIGRELLRAAEDFILRSRPNVFLCVSSFNTGAQRFYAGCGYERIGEIRDYLVPGHSEFLMRKTVGPWSEFHRAGAVESDADAGSGGL
jgi:ribosomal protein S18 acetylase RimI-like enzyme